MTGRETEQDRGHSQQRGVGDRRDDFADHGTVCHDRGAEVALHHVPQPFKILDGEGLIEAIRGLDFGDHLGRGVLGQHRADRIAGRQMDKGKANDRDANDNRQCVEQAAENV